MYHYVALAWSSSDTNASLEALRTREALLHSSGGAWTIVINADGFTVFAKVHSEQTDTLYLMHNQRGVIFGKLFSSAQLAQPITSSGLPATAIVDSDGQWLIDNCWGRYVAVLHCTARDTCCVLRDCSGQIPCFYTRINGLSIFFSDVLDIDCLRVGLTLNNRYLSAFIYRQPLHVRETGLTEITELLAGDYVTVSRHGIKHTCGWNPRTFAVTPVTYSYERARSTLVGLTESVIAAWALPCRRILLSISGGLDSAIVLGCLKRLGFADRVVCLTQYTPGTADDERSYARAAAQMAHVQMIELPRISDGLSFAAQIQAVPPDPRPDIVKLHKALTLTTFNCLAEEYGCDALWTGQGGDQIFLQAHHPYGFADFVMQHRLSSRLPALLYESALLSRRSVWDVLRLALAYRFDIHKTPRLVVGGCGQRFLTSSATQFHSDESLTSPWRLGDERMPPGKVDQLDVLFDLVNRHKPMIELERPYEQHPLISQPLIEYSLQVPTYELLRGGRQRAMARNAFADRVPSCIITREDKGSTHDQFRCLLRGSAPFIREALLDGYLVSTGIVDRAALEGILRHEETFATDDAFPLLACIAAETWVQHWKPKVTQAVAA